MKSRNNVPGSLLALALLAVAGAASAKVPAPAAPMASEGQGFVVTQCTIPEGLADSPTQLSLAGAATALETSTGRLRLVRRGDRLDIQLQTSGAWRGTDGAQLDAASATDGTFHLVRRRHDGPEHFLFLIDPSGSGDLLWSTATMSAQVHCAPPVAA